MPGSFLLYIKKYNEKRARFWGSKMLIIPANQIVGICGSRSDWGMEPNKEALCDKSDEVD